MFNKKDTQKNNDNTESVDATEMKGKVLSGIVTSDKMMDTGVVEVQRYFKHPKYGKFIKTGKKYKFHDVGNTAKIGDTVKIVETKPISKDKNFLLLEIVSAAPVIDMTDIADDKESEDKE